jgi:EAL domain-containing protein (putative c-di-GMP-specific phosphodiesterase class I)
MGQMGTRVVIDDFGTGYSSLSRLHRLPVSGIKIDESFISSLDGNADARKVVAAIAALSLDLGLEVAAEGIERKSQRRLLTELGCNLGQGSLLGRPMTAPQVVEFLSSGERESP